MSPVRILSIEKSVVWNAFEKSDIIALQCEQGHGNKKKIVKFKDLQLAPVSMEHLLFFFISFCPFSFGLIESFLSSSLPPA